MTGKEIQSFNKNFSRFGPYEPLARHLRFRQTRAAIRHHEIKLKHTIKELNIDTLGPRFLPRLTVIQNEKKAAWWHQAKNNGVEPEFLEILNNIPGFFRPVSEKWIHLDQQTPNLMTDAFV